MKPTAHLAVTSLNELTDTKYVNPCRPKIQPPPTENKIAINFITVTYIKILDAYINCVSTKAYIKTTVELDVLTQMTTP